MTVTIKPAGRTLAKFQPLKPAEQKLLKACRQGTVAHISDKRPEAASDDNTVRATFLRFLAIGGDAQAPVHEHGVQLFGAWIDGELDMVAVSVSSDFTIAFCYFDTSPVFRGAMIAGALNLGGCQLPGLAGESLVCDGNLLLHLGFIATKTVRLRGAKVGGDLECRSAKFDGVEGDALSADGVVIQGSIFLNQKFTAMGEVRLLNAQIGGNLDCGSAKFDGKQTGYALSVDGAVIKGNVFLREGFAAMGVVRLPGVHIGGDLECHDAKFDGKDGDALMADGMVVEGTFFFRNLATPVNGVSLAASRVGRLADDAMSWGKELVFNGFVYGGIIGDAPTDATARLKWLDRQYKPHTGVSGYGAEFKPQPWRQLAKVLREMGHAEDARQVAIAFEHRLRDANLIGQTPKHWGKLSSLIYRNLSRTGHWLFWVFTGYGYRPLRLLGWMFSVWLVCAMFYWYAALVGVFAPSSPLVFQNPAYEACRSGYVAPAPQGKTASAVPPSVQGAGNWYLCEKLPEEYSGFSPLAYSLDVILPLVDLQQETSWSPLIQVPKNVWYQELATFDLKHLTRLVLWFEILFGWVSSLLLVAVVSGLTKRREE